MPVSETAMYKNHNAINVVGIYLVIRARIFHASDTKILSHGENVSLSFQAEYPCL